jgi:hypothetical protein
MENFKKFQKQFNFSEEIVLKVKNNWLSKENKEAFDYCKTDSDRCIAFFRLSVMDGCETSLGDKIMYSVFEQMEAEKLQA